MPNGDCGSYIGHFSNVILLKLFSNYSQFPKYWEGLEIANPVSWICSCGLPRLLNFTPFLLLHENEGGNIHGRTGRVPYINITLHYACSHICPWTLSVPRSQ